MSDINGNNVSAFNAVVLGRSGNVVMKAGTGSPEGVVTGDIGSTYQRTDGGAGTSYYVKESGTGSTGWAAYQSTASVLPTTQQLYVNGGTPVYRETYERIYTSGAVAMPATGIMLNVAVPLYAGDIITNISFRVTGSYTTPTAWFVALYDTQATPALVAQSADQATGTLLSGALKTIALGSPAPYTVPTTGIYWASFGAAHGGAGTFLGTTLGISGGVYVTGQHALTTTSGSGLTGTAPATITGASSNTSHIYMALS